MDQAFSFWHFNNIGEVFSGLMVLGGWMFALGQTLVIRYKTTVLATERFEQLRHDVTELKTHVDDLTRIVLKHFEGRK